MRVKVCKYKEIGKYKRFTAQDVHRIIDSIRLNHRVADTTLMSSILHAFGIKEVVCGVVGVVSLLNSIGLVGALYIVFKMVKGLIVLYNLIRNASLKILKATVLFISFEITSTVLSKVALRFVAFSAALDVLLGALALYADYLAALNPFVQFMKLVCDEEDGSFTERSEPVIFALEAAKIATEINNNRVQMVDAIQEIDETGGELNQ